MASSGRDGQGTAGHTAFAAGELSSARFLSLDFTGGGVVSCGTLACACKVCQQSCCMQQKLARQCICLQMPAAHAAKWEQGYRCSVHVDHHAGNWPSACVSHTVTADRSLPHGSNLLASFSDTPTSMRISGSVPSNWDIPGRRVQTGPHRPGRPAGQPPGSCWRCSRALGGAPAARQLPAAA